MEKILCTRCLTKKPKSEFYFRHSENKVRTPCKECHKKDYERLVVAKRPKPIMFLHKDEKWFPIIGFEGLYDVSDFGNVRSHPRGKNRGGLIKQRVNHFGYYVVCLCKKNKKTTHFVHRLVSTAFIQNPENKRQVNHKDGVKTNNKLKNLEWATQSENVQHAYDTGLTKCRVGENHQMAKYKNSLILKVFKAKGTHQEIADKFGLGRRHVGHIKEGHIWGSVTGKQKKTSLL